MNKYYIDRDAGWCSRIKIVEECAVFSYIKDEFILIHPEDVEVSEDRKNWKFKDDSDFHEEDSDILNELIYDLDSDEEALLFYEVMQ